MTILITGSNGFVGTAVSERLRKDGAQVRRAIRSLSEYGNDLDVIGVGDISSQTDWSLALNNVQQVIHLAAHIDEVQSKNKSEALEDFRRVNVEGSVNLARYAAAGGVKRFIYLSSIKVNGEKTDKGRPFVFSDDPNPQSPYAISKFEAEKFLRQEAARTGMELVIIRPTLIYGFGVKGSFRLMMRWIISGLPIPLGAFVSNQRSFVALGNLVDLIVTCLNHPAAANKTFLICDGEDLSTADLLKRLSICMNKSAKLWSLPPLFLLALAKLFRKTHLMNRLLGNLQVDMSYTCKTLDWSPPLSVEEGLKQAVQGARK